MTNHRVSKGAQRRSRYSASHGIKKQTTSTRKVESHELRRSARLSAILQSESSENRRKESNPGLPSAGGIAQDRAKPRVFDTSCRPLSKRKRDHEVQSSSLPAQSSLPAKRPRTSAQGTTEGRTQEAENYASIAFPDPLQNWVLNGRWPHDCFEPDDQAREELLEHNSWLEETLEQPPIPMVEYVERNGFRYLRPFKKSSASLRRKQSDASLTGSSDQKKRENKSAPYRDLRYATLLAAKGSYMENSDLGIANSSLHSYKTLLSSDQTYPTASLFRDDVFEATCRSVQDRNESRVIRSISPYIMPSAEDFAIMGATKLKCLIENVNEAWTGSIPVEGPRPQPDYSVGFRRSAFTKEQLNKLDPLVGSVFDTSFFVATFRMYFPFLTGEVKCGAATLDIADRQNAHSMTIAVRDVVELYKAVKREKELSREILAFSISHDHNAVRIYGHYAVIDKNEPTFYRHPVKKFDFTSEEGADKCTAYQFIKNVYDIWMPIHLQRICSAIDQLPSNLDFELVEGSGGQSNEATELSQDMGSLHSGPSDIDNAPQIGQKGNELSSIVPQTITPDSSMSKEWRQGAAKRAKKNPLQK